MRDHYSYFAAFLLLLLSMTSTICYWGERHLFRQHMKVCKGIREQKIHFGLTELRIYDEDETRPDAQPSHVDEISADSSK